MGVTISQITRQLAAITGDEFIEGEDATGSFKVTLDAIIASAAVSVRSVSADYTITGRLDSPIVNVTTGATDRTITLPLGSVMEAGDEIEVHKVDSGTGKVTVTRAGSDTIDGVTSIDVDSQYDYAKFRWMGTYWSLLEYKDHIESSSNYVYRYADGRMTESFTFSIGASATSGSVSFPTTFGHSVRSVQWIPDCLTVETEAASIAGLSTTGFTFGLKEQLGNARTGRAIAEGRWRA